MIDPIQRAARTAIDTETTKMKMTLTDEEKDTMAKAVAKRIVHLEETPMNALIFVLGDKMERMTS